MSGIIALVSGTLSRDPQGRTTSKGDAMATSSLAVQASSDGKPAYVGLLAFNDLAETLLQCTKGDAVSVRGRLELSRWTNAEGQAKEQWQLVADSLLAGPEKPSRVRTAPRPGRDTGRDRAPAEPPPFDDEIAF